MELRLPVVGRRARGSVVDPAGLHHRPGGVADDHGCVVGAVDRDGDRLRRRPAVAVGDLDRVGLHQHLVDSERLPQRVVGRKQPGDLSHAVTGGLVGHDGGEVSEVADVPGRHRGNVSVGEVDVAETDRADRYHHRQRPFRHRSAVHRCRDERGIVGRQRDRKVATRDIAVTVDDLNRDIEIDRGGALFGSTEVADLERIAS